MSLIMYVSKQAGIPAIPSFLASASSWKLFFLETSIEDINELAQAVESWKEIKSSASILDDPRLLKA